MQRPKRTKGLTEIKKKKSKQQQQSSTIKFTGYGGAASVIEGLAVPCKNKKIFPLVRAGALYAYD